MDDNINNDKDNIQQPDLEDNIQPQQDGMNAAIPQGGSGFVPDSGKEPDIDFMLRLRRLRRSRFKLIISALFSAVLIVFIVLFAMQLDRKITTQRGQAVEFYSSTETIETADIVERMQQFSDKQINTAVITKINSGTYSLREQLLRVFTAPYYLARSQDDNEFIRESYNVITGQRIDNNEIEQAELLLQQTGSRLSWLDYLCDTYDVPGAALVSAEPTRIRTFTLVSDLPEQGERIIGLLPVSAEMKIAGDEARIKLFSNGHLQQSHSYEKLRSQMMEDQIENESIVTIYWDTRYERSGSHKLDYLIQTSDGRGEWISLDSFIVPEVTALELGQIKPDELVYPADDDSVLDNSMEAWYRIDSSDNEALLTLFQADADLDLELFNIMGSQRADSTSREGIHAALRYRGTQEDILPLSLRSPEHDKQEGTSFYIRVSKKNKQLDRSVHFSLVQAETVAMTAQAPYRYVSVMETADEELLIAEPGKQVSWQPAENYDVLYADSRLAALKLEDISGSQINFAPVFDNDNFLYGLYVEQETGLINFETWSVEGSAAQLEVVVEYEDGDIIALESEDLLELRPSVNNLRLAVKGYNGETNIYELKVLRTPALDGYHEILEAFPLSYRTPLWSVHIEWPDWDFRPDNTEIIWSDFIEAQDELDKNLVDAYYSPDHWVEADSPVYDGAAWKAATTEVISYFADPRHGLNSIDIFQFESLKFEPAVHTREGVEAMLENTFMASDNDEGLDYAQMIYNAGEQADISPFFIAAKILQEMGPQGLSVLAYGELPDYEGIYNFYNIGSTPNPEVEDGALINGARFAQFGKDPSTEELDEEEERWLIPWDTPQKAITGGAIWIADRYVAIGQDTLYGQKFDLIADPDLFTRQYAQNVQMAWAEGRRTYRAYKDLELLDQPFAFKIPVFVDMPPDIPQWP